MNRKILLAYATNSGSTADVAEKIAEHLTSHGNQVDLRRIDEAPDPGGYDAIVVGAPMILGWHRQARRFVHRHRQALSRLPVAYFMTAVSLTHHGETSIDGVPVWIDPEKAKEIPAGEKMGLHERYSWVGNYLRPVLRAAPQVQPVSVAFFGGRLDMGKLKPLQFLFVLVAIQAQPGDFRNWENIQAWADWLSERL
jgi:menaquinone-dependent protoporphyrinogen oxidase